MQQELLYQLALTRVPHIGDIRARALINHFGSAKNIFQASKKELDALDGIGTVRAASIKKFRDFDAAESEIGFIEKYKITPLFITDKAYPQRLLNCYDCPCLLYYKGSADLNASKIIAIVGTRNNDEYGRNLCEKLIEDMAEHDVTVISGLAFGIDSIAHKCCVKNNVATVGVLAHGLDRVYPAQNRSLATQMIKHGGLLTEYPSNTNPDRQNFPTRNRIVAGMSDCIVVIETGIKGGSLITAELANGYNRDVFAFPGRTSDAKSEGCNYLIRSNKAALITNANDLLENMSWTEQKKRAIKKQRELFLDFTPDEKVVIDILQENEQVHIDELYLKSKLSSSAVAQALLMLEMQGVVSAMPGKMYKVSG